MRSLHIVLPMAGYGSRFANAGYATPKPLIEVDGQPMFRKALSSLDSIQAKKRYTVIIRKEHDEQYQLADKLEAALPTVNVVISSEKATGALADACRSREFLDSNEGIILLDCDLWFRSQPYFDMVQDSLNGHSDLAGGLLAFKSDDPRYSYAAIDNRGIVTRTAEKQVISSHAITGAYFIASSEIFLKAADEILGRRLSDEMPEYYVSHIYNVIIQNGGKVMATSAEQHNSFGTPEELAVYKSLPNQMK